MIKVLNTYYNILFKWECQFIKIIKIIYEKITQRGRDKIESSVRTPILIYETLFFLNRVVEHIIQKWLQRKRLCPQFVVIT